MALSAKQLALHVARALEQNRNAVLAYWWPQTWTEGNELNVHGNVLPVTRCDSVLSLREQLADDHHGGKVLLVSVPETELGQDVLARIHLRRLLHVERWQMVEEAFGTRQIDPRLYSLSWMATALLDLPATSLGNSIGALTFERAIELCVASILGCSASRIELDDLLAGCERATSVWKELPSERKDVFAKFLGDRFGPIASALLGAVSAGYGHAVVSIGLACEVLYGERLRRVPAIRDSQIRLETYLAGFRISDADGKQWAQAAERVVRSRTEPERLVLFQGATDLLRTLGAGNFIVESGVLPIAFDERLDQLGTAIQHFLKKSEKLPEVEQAAAWVGLHRLIPEGHPGEEAARKAVALCRREATFSADGPPSNLILDYLQNGAWEDFARRVLRGVRPDAFSRGVSMLLERVGNRRMSADQKFAAQLAESLANASIPSGLIPVEAALERLLAPLASQMPVVMIVLDGMSWDVYYGLAQDLEKQGWEGRRFEQGPMSLLATVPSVTECSRASLLCGRLVRGTSANEKVGFSTHASLVRASRTGKSPVLLHKAEVASGNQLSESAARLLADAEQQIVGIVINAIDDALAKSDQVRLDWRIESIPLLGAILTQARLASRAVLITSDHGHVLEMISQYRAAGSAERWRSIDEPPTEGEIQISGNRVRTLMNADVVVPWSEKLRYATKKNGYHGGATRQEMLVPLGLWMPSPSIAPNWPVHLLRNPDWWESAPQDFQPIPIPTPNARTGKQDAQPDLFSVKADKSWITGLLISSVMIRQRERVGRVSLEDDRLSRLLQCLEQRGGRATTHQLAIAVEQPPLRMRGIVSALQRMLNVDGYPIVTMETATGTVILDQKKLREQFEI